jgi:hypothetical protein
MRIGAVMLFAAALASSACSGRGGLNRQYEYEEEMYLSLDGSATVFVHSSVPALNLLRGSTFDASPSARLDRAAVRQFFSTPVTRVTRVSSSRRNNRVFAHVRLEVADVRRLGEAAPFAWSTYRVEKDDEVVSYRQNVGRPADAEMGMEAGDEIVAFRLHLPSEIVSHNSPSGVQRGNILRWEQTLAERAHGDPVAIDVRMSGQSIFSRTLQIFGAALIAVAITFATAIWWAVRRGGRSSRAQHA